MKAGQSQLQLGWLSKLQAVQKSLSLAEQSWVWWLLLHMCLHGLCGRNAGILRIREVHICSSLAIAEDGP